jgi:hypothetical protein
MLKTGAEPGEGTPEADDFTVVNPQESSSEGDEWEVLPVEEEGLSIVAENEGGLATALQQQSTWKESGWQPANPVKQKDPEASQPNQEQDKKQAGEKAAVGEGWAVKVTVKTGLRRISGRKEAKPSNGVEAEFAPHAPRVPSQQHMNHSSYAAALEKSQQQGQTKQPAGASVASR